MSVLEPMWRGVRNFREDVSAAWPNAGIARRYWYVYSEPGLRAILNIRFQIFFEEIGLAVIGRLVRLRNSSEYGIDWVPGARAAGGLVIRHPSGIVVGNGVRIGRGVTVLQNVTIGRVMTAEATSPGDPIVGDGVLIGAGAVLLGSIHVGAGASIGANAVVTADVAPGTSVVGIPARSRNGEAK